MTKTKKDLASIIDEYDLSLRELAVAEHLASRYVEYHAAVDRLAKELVNFDYSRHTGSSSKGEDMEQVAGSLPLLGQRLRDALSLSAVLPLRLVSEISNNAEVRSLLNVG